MTEGRRFDIISDLKQKPFSRRSEVERFKILTDGRPKVSISLVKPDGCGKTRRFSKVWYNKADWLCGSSERQAASAVLLAVHVTVHQVIAMVINGLHRFENFPRGVHGHAACTDHIRCDKILKRMMTKQPSIDAMLSKQKAEENDRFNENMQKNREVFKRLIDVTVMLAMQEQAFRGHDESADSQNKGNYREFLECCMKHYRALYDHWKANVNFSGESKTIQNELIT